MFVVAFPEIAALERDGPAPRPKAPCWSAVIFNAIIILMLVPLALEGSRVPPRQSRGHPCAATWLIYGLGGLIAPFFGIKLIDVVISALHWV